MSIKRIIVTTFLPLICVSLLSSQSLVELAKKEKERREKLKGKTAVVITNAHLKRLKKEPAISVTRSSYATQVSTKEKKISVRPLPYKAQSSVAKNVDREDSRSSKMRQDKWEKANELVGLLSLKMNALWQEFYSLDDMTDRSSIQRQISETYLRLQKAQQDAEKSKQELDNSRTQKNK